ncbi:hypothetical protein PAL_GLEAN10002174 [Pteropus alecto]|uniref:Uncharacterized protein n=1 Tax=Pteropus alecto TaxID=9402 RepID=L5K768_PTEAL|nr:hypothetical protein PAL_GLEAN10002174 [Pteropus alecto]
MRVSMPSGIRQISRPRAERCCWLSHEHGKFDRFSPRVCGTFQAVSQPENLGLRGATAVPAQSDIVEVACIVPGLPETAEGRTMVTLAQPTARRI